MLKYQQIIDNQQISTNSNDISTFPQEFFAIENRIIAKEIIQVCIATRKRLAMRHDFFSKLTRASLEQFSQIHTKPASLRIF